MLRLLSVSGNKSLEVIFKLCYMHGRKKCLNTYRK